MNNSRVFYAAFFSLLFAVTLTVNCSKKHTRPDRKPDKKNFRNIIKKDSEKITAGKGKAGPEISCSGRYRLIIPGFKGFLTLSADNKTGKIKGTIKFDTWGKGIPEPLKNIKINDKKIFFIRSIQSSDEMRKYGSSRLFKQKFYGEFSENGSVIKGFFVETGTETNWRAERMPEK